MTRPFDWCDTHDTIVLGHLEWLALLYVPLIAAYDRTALDIPAALAALAQGEALIADERGKAYDAARVQLVRGLAFLSRLPGGYTFGRITFGG